MKYCYKYPRPALTVDTVVFGYPNEELSVLLIQRSAPPFQGHWALPGGFVEIDENLEDAARRELWEETGIRAIDLEQLHTFGEVRRDPRERVVSVAYLALVRPTQMTFRAGSDAQDAKWFSIRNIPPLAFDHEHIIRMAITRLREKLMDKPAGFELLPREFTLSQLQKLYEAILEQPLDKRNFRKKILSLGCLIALSKKLESVPHRSPVLYSFLNRRMYEKSTYSGRYTERFSPGWGAGSASWRRSDSGS